MSAVPTPDFYEYPWTPLHSVEVDGRFTTLVWDDGATLSALDLWLRENAVGQGGVDLATREGLFDPADLTHDVAVTSATVTNDGALEVVFAPDGTTARYHPGWLRHVADGNHRASSWLPASSAWTPETFTEPPTHDGGSVLTDDSVFGLWLDDLVRYGISRLRGCPLDSDFNLQLAQRIGAIRDTNFGPIWDVKADISMAGSDDTNSTANTICASVLTPICPPVRLRPASSFCTAC